MPDTHYEDDLIVDETEVQEAKPAARRRRLPPSAVLIALAAIVLLVAGVAVALPWLRDGGDPETHGAVVETAAYVDAPAMVVNMRSADGRTHFLKLRFVIVAARAQETARITERMPVIVDGLQSFLRELRPEDLSGSAAVFRVKEEMMIRTQAVLGKGKVRDILIQDLVEQ